MTPKSEVVLEFRVSELGCPELQPGKEGIKGRPGVSTVIGPGGIAGRKGKNGAPGEKGRPVSTAFYHGKAPVRA